ncbi:hypothetical protein D3C73_923450 [compost metagenome]
MLYSASATMRRLSVIEKPPLANTEVRSRPLSRLMLVLALAPSAGFGVWKLPALLGSPPGPTVSGLPPTVTVPHWVVGLSASTSSAWRGPPG